MIANKIEFRKILIVLTMFILVYAFCIYNIFMLSQNEEYVKQVNAQSENTVLIASSKGTIYDCNIIPLTNTGESLLAVVMPDYRSITEIFKVTNEIANPENIVQSGMPYVLNVDVKTDGEYVDYFEVPKRYPDEPLASNLIGYIDGSGNGVTGVERAFNEILSKNSGKLTLSYTSNALGNIILGEDRYYKNTLNFSTSGIALTIDSDIQKIAQDAAEKLETGAVVVLSSDDAQIKAIVSTPSYEQNNLGEALNSEDSPMINRAFSSYAPGSVFKLVIATAALNSNIDLDDEYVCTGSVIVDGIEMTCNDHVAHGNVNMHTAIQHSCNSYFIDLGLRISGQVLYETAKNFGLGTATYLYNDFYTDSGSILETDEISGRGDVANFSIGQGDVRVTPLQVAVMINTIISNGRYIAPTLYLGEVNSNMELERETENKAKAVVMETDTALRLKSYMESVVTYGTGRKGDVEGYSVGAKTGTAQTGVYENGSELFNFWYGGYISDGKDEYVIVVLNEGVKESQNYTGEVFNEIATYISEKYLYK